MAPKRKQTTPKETVAAAADKVLRRSSRLSNGSAAPPPAADPQPPKKKKPITKPKPKPKAEAKEEVEEAPKKKKIITKPKAEPKAEAKEEVEEAPPSPAVEDPASEPETVKGSKTIVIEHCKQCNAFKTRAIQVKEALERDVAGVKVVVNGEKPRRGCFEIREECGDIFVSLLDMKRPFPPLKALDMDKLISDIVEKLR